MRKSWLTAIAILSFVTAARPLLAGDPSLTPVGTWATKDAGSHIEIKDCGGKLCGTIAWLKNPLDKDGKDKLDTENPDPALRMRKILGLPLLNGFVRESDSNIWSGGTIYDPDSGKTYSCKLTAEPDGQLLVRGFIGVSLFGRTEAWTRVK